MEHPYDDKAMNTRSSTSTYSYAIRGTILNKAQRENYNVCIYHHKLSNSMEA